MNSIKITYFAGEEEISATYPKTSETSVRKALEDLGCRIVKVEEV